MENLREVLGAADLGFEDLVKTTIYVVDLGEFDIINGIYGDSERALPGAGDGTGGRAPRGARIEIDAIARKHS